MAVFDIYMQHINIKNEINSRLTIERNSC